MVQGSAFFVDTIILDITVNFVNQHGLTLINIIFAIMTGKDRQNVLNNANDVLFTVWLLATDTNMKLYGTQSEGKIARDCTYKFSFRQTTLLIRAHEILKYTIIITPGSIATRVPKYSTQPSSTFEHTKCCLPTEPMGKLLAFE